MSRKNEHPISTALKDALAVMVIGLIIVFWLCRWAYGQ